MNEKQWKNYTDRGLGRLGLGLLAPLGGGIGSRAGLLALPVLDGGPDRVLREHRAMKLHRREGEVLGYFGILDLEAFVDSLA